MTSDRFFEITRNLNRDKFHTCCEMKLDGINCDWYIFRKDMSWEEYWSEDNKPILTSIMDTEQDLIEFCSIKENLKIKPKRRSFYESIRRIFCK